MGKTALNFYEVYARILVFNQKTIKEKQMNKKEILARIEKNQIIIIEILLKSIWKTIQNLMILKKLFYQR